MERATKILTAKEASKLGGIDIIIPYGYDVIGENIFVRKKTIE